MWPAGTLVTGWHRESEMCVRSSCSTHLWLTVTGPQPVDYACGFIQAARCVVCDYLTPLLDADWWSEKATVAEIEVLVGLLREERARLARVIDSLGRDGTGDSVLRNFE